jgi:hypothetical protein
MIKIPSAGGNGIIGIFCTRLRKSICRKEFRSPLSTFLRKAT